MRTSVYLYDEAINEVKNYLASEELQWNEGERWVGDYSIEFGSADCSAFPCPERLDNWSGETSAIYVYKDNKEVFAVAYWCCEDIEEGEDE